jgi:uncharacterized phage infection (PIP) family protein YhgE
MLCGISTSRKELTMQNDETTTRATALPDSDKLKADAEKLKSKAADIAEEAKAHGKDQLTTGKQTAAAKVERLADVLEQTTEGLQKGEQQTLASYANELASGVRNLATNLRERSVDDLITDAQTLARRNPTLFFLGSVAVGVVLSRFLKASADQSRRPSNVASYNTDATEQVWDATDQPADRRTFSAESTDPDAEAEPAAAAEAKGY